MPALKPVQEPSLDSGGWWSPLFGAGGLIVCVFAQAEKHAIQRCTPWNSLALHYNRGPGRWGHAYLPEHISISSVEVYGPPATSVRSGVWMNGLFTADRITLYGEGLHRGACEFAIAGLIHELREGYYPYANIIALFGNDTAASPEVFGKLRIAMRALIALYEAEASVATVTVPEEWRSIWTDENGSMRRDISRPWRYRRNEIESWAAACLISAGGSVRRIPDGNIAYNLQGQEYTLNDVHWFFESVGYSPTTWWHYWGKFVLAFSEAALKGGIMSASVALQTDGSMVGALESFADSITKTFDRNAPLPTIVCDIEPASELIAGVTLTFTAKLVLSVFCAYATAGGPWLVIWLTTALSRWSMRDFGSMRQGGTCGGAGTHIHINNECRVRLLNTTCISSAGSEHSRVLGVVMTLVGWVVARCLYSYYPEARTLLVVGDWDSTTGFMVGNVALIMVCGIGLLTMRYTLPKFPRQQYFLWRMILEWILAALAIGSVFVPAMVLRTTTTRWMITAELAAWTIDFFMTTFVIGTYPDCITPWHSVWVLVPALLSAIGGMFGCWY
jgi:hypothetical protein